ncbi:MAG: GtrA family protein [Fibrobacterales bacterium]
MVRLLFSTKTDHVSIQFFRYLIVGGLAFIVDYSLLNLFTDYLGVHYLISQVIGYIAGLFINYFLSIRWVFNNRNVENKRHEFLIFAFIGLIGLGINTFVLWVFKEHLFMLLINTVPEYHQRYSKLAATALVFAWNFIARKLTLFR